MIYIKICYLLSCLVVVYRQFAFLLKIFQQEHYHVRGFLKTFKSYYTKKPLSYILLIILILSLFNNAYIYATCVFIVFLSLFIKEKSIKKLIITNRIKRLFLSFTILTIIVFSFSIKYPFLFTIYMMLPFIVVFINLINMPVEHLINKRYLKKAKAKLLQNKDLIKIAVTGSYGKTSTKNIITNILENKYLTLKTPASFNTLLGLSKTINTSLNNSYEVAVFEMGASKVGDIKEMAKFIDPDISIITDIGPQHIETFKSIENVIKTKFELIDQMKENDVAILNGDNEHIKSRIINNVNNIYYYGFNKNSNAFASNIITVNGVTKFDIFYNNQFVTRVETHLLGTHNILNILASFLVFKVLIDKYKFDLNIEEFTKEISNLKQITHRLSYEKRNNIHVYDDSYNSNIKGFKSSIDVISKIPYKKIIITPGIVDAGSLTKTLNEDISKRIKEVFDDIYIIDSYSGKYIYNALISQDNVHLNKTFIDAYNEVITKYQEEVVLLIENDLPDNYLLRRS